MPATDDFSRFQTSQLSPATNAAAITTSDTVDLANVTRAIYVGVGGDVKVDMQDSGTVTFVGVPTGTTLAIRATRVYATVPVPKALDLIALW